MPSDREQLLACYRTMMRIRVFESRMESMCAEGCVPGTFHSSAGQEAIPTGVAAACGSSDTFISNHRGHGHLIAKGGDLGRLVAELFGRREGYAGGRGGTQHIAAFDIGFLGAMGITGGGLPIATGVGLAAKLQQRDAVSVAFLGDGATNQGTFHESLNIASVVGSRTLFVCENNGYAMGTPTSYGVAGGEIHRRADAYGIEHARVDGNDVEAVLAAARHALEYIRSSGKPYFLECVTYRIRGHSKSDGAPYRSSEELAEWQARDPIERAQASLVQRHEVQRDDLVKIEAELQAEVDAAIEFARGGTPGDREFATAGVFATPIDLAKAEPPQDAAATEMTYREAVALALREEMRRDPDVFLWGEDIANYSGAFKVTRGFAEEFGRGRVIDAPISENGIVGVATGAALAGMRPVAEIMFMDFMMLALDQLGNHAAKLRYLFGEQCRVPMVVRTPAGGYRGYGATHSQSLQSTLMTVPGLKIVAPSTPRDARALLKAAIRDDDPVVFVEHKLLYGQKGLVPEAEELGVIGRARVALPGEDVTVVTHSYMTSVALQAAEALAKAGTSVEVVDLRTLAPIDWETVVASAKKTQRAVVVEEGPRTAGVGAEIAAVLQERAFGYLDAPVLRVAASDCPIPTGPEMEKAVLPSGQDIVRAVESVISFEG